MELDKIYLRKYDSIVKTKDDILQVQDKILRN